MAEVIGSIAHMAAGMSYLEFSRRVGSLISGRASVNRVPLGDLPPSLWVTGTGCVRQYASEYELRTALTLETGRPWTGVRNYSDPNDKVSSLMPDINVSCSLLYATQRGQLSLKRVRSPTLCHHFGQQLPSGWTGSEGLVLPVSVPFQGDMIEGRSCQIGVNHVIGFKCRHKWSLASQLVREPPTAGWRNQPFSLSRVGQGTGCRIIHHSDQGLESVEVACPEMLTYSFPKGMCVMGGMLYVFGTFPDAASGRNDVNSPSGINRLFAMHLDTREWVEVERGDGFPSDPVSLVWHKNTGVPRGGRFDGRVELFSLDGALYVMLYTTPEVEQKTHNHPPTTLHRYCPDIPEGTSPWTQLRVGPLLRPSCVATHNGRAHILGDDALRGPLRFNGYPVHSTFRPTVDTGTTTRLLDETDNGWENGWLAAPAPECDNAFTMGGRLCATTTMGVLLTYNDVLDRWEEQDEVFHSRSCGLCPLDPGTVLQYGPYYPRDYHQPAHTVVIHYPESYSLLGTTVAYTDTN
ncbi:hypothetical protein KIPB_008005 [Kipferlia bialata]|uniref:Uncharacterized protein n=1 Tax=Kipferlia bialata TaxID=797122 RepID=A0A9K3GJ63_9EUKA|nr:hypothetical protein KIPB_004964 [Kipferlia bialata]GIQ84285.1 hypothetical protein KIPB_005746 [Kipferlia bialata]GIQ86199.1 hypothetical protein KIPB_008005 [Kipferlia bialata]|eukprot:g4964.t1